MNVLDEAQAAEILARMVAEQLDQGPIPPNKVIFEGNVMDRTEAAALVDARIIASRKAAMFDVQDTIQDYMSLSRARQRLRSNILFGLRYRIVNAAKNIFFGMNAAARETGHMDNFNEFLAELDAAEQAAQYAEELGYAEFGVGMRKIKALLSIYEQWGRAAYADAEALGLGTWSCPTLRDAIHEEPQQMPDALERELAIVRIEYDEMYGETTMGRIHSAVLRGETDHGDLDKEAFEGWKEVVRLARESTLANYDAKVGMAHKVAPYVERIIVEAGRVPEQVEFFQLAPQTQQALIESVDRAAAKLPDQLKNDRYISTSDLLMHCVEIRKLRRKLAEVLSDPRFE